MITKIPKKEFLLNNKLEKENLLVFDLMDEIINKLNIYGREDIIISGGICLLALIGKDIWLEHHNSSIIYTMKNNDVDIFISNNVDTKTIENFIKTFNKKFNKKFNLSYYGIDKNYSEYKYISLIKSYCENKKIKKIKNKYCIKISFNLKHRYDTVDDLLDKFDLSPCKIAYNGENIFFHENFNKDFLNITYEGRLDMLLLNRLCKYKDNYKLNFDINDIDNRVEEYLKDINLIANMRVVISDSF